MLYKVTPMLPEEPVKKPRKPREPGQPRRKRKSAIYDSDGHEVLITLMCLKCRKMKPLMQFGLRKMADGAIRNQPWCRACRSGSSSHKPKVEEAAPAVEAPVGTKPQPAAEMATEGVSAPPGVAPPDHD